MGAAQSAGLDSLSTPGCGTFSYVEIADELRRRIAARDPEICAAGGRVAKETHLAERFGVSRGTIAKAVHVLVDEGLVRRQRGAGTFLVEGDEVATPGREIGLLFAESAAGVDRFGGVPLGPRQSRLAAAGFTKCALLPCAGGTSLRGFGTDVAGLLIAGEPDADEWPYSAAGELEAPCVSYLTDISWRGVTSVAFDLREAARRQTAALLAAGHRRIAVLCPPAHVLRQREVLEGYRLALAAAGITPQPHWQLTTRLGPRAAEEAVCRLLEPAAPCTAVLVPYDGYAIYLLLKLRARGVEAPRDLSVASAEHDPAHPFVEEFPPLATVTFSEDAATDAAARLLREQLAGAAERGGCLRLPGTVRTGKTIGPVKA